MAGTNVVHPAAAQRSASQEARDTSLTFSVVIVTFNAPPTLERLLHSLRWQRYEGDFEVIVVYGPAVRDETAALARRFPDIRLGRCPIDNIATARNIGIGMARGDIVAFTHPDAIPHPEWLAQLAAAFADPAVGAAGGYVLGATGFDYEYRYCLANRLGDPDRSAMRPEPHLAFPSSYCFPHLSGANSSFRRSALAEIGGFDEAYAYYLEDTDICLRLVDAGYVIAQVPGARVQHARPDVLDIDEGALLHRRSAMVGSKIYFMLRHARDFHSLEHIFREQRAFLRRQREDLAWAIGANGLTGEAVARFDEASQRALERGLKDGLEGARARVLRAACDPDEAPHAVLPFQRTGSDRLTIVLVSRDFPPDHAGGIAILTSSVSQVLAAQGNVVHVIAESPDIARIDFERGVWVHRITVAEAHRPDAAVRRNVPAHIWNWSAAALNEARRIAACRPIDVVEAPIWECQGIAFLLSGAWPLVTSLQTPLHFWMDSHPEYASEPTWLAETGLPSLRLEHELMTRSNAVRAISAAIRSDIEARYGMTFADDKIVIAPLGLENLDPVAVPPRSGKSKELLFVGRLEYRKGIDVLLQAMTAVLEADPDVHLRVVGDDTQPGPDGITFRQAFLDSEAGRRWGEHVTFDGRVDDEALREVYAACDIFVAPSRYESFGLIYLEAMREAKPVIACASGGVGEIVVDGETGLLVPPGDADALARAILRLLRSPELRRQMGAAGRRRFLERFTSEQMVEPTRDLYRRAMLDFERAEAAGAR